MRILVFNSGNSSLKFQVSEGDADMPVSLLRGAVCDLDGLAHRRHSLFRLG